MSADNLNAGADHVSVEAPSSGPEPSCVMVLPSAPILIPDLAGVAHADVAEVVQAADQMLSRIEPDARVGILTGWDRWSDESPSAPGGQHPSIPLIPEAVAGFSGRSALAVPSGWVIGGHLLRRTGRRRPARLLLVDGGISAGGIVRRDPVAEPEAGDRIGGSSPAGIDATGIDVMLVMADGSAGRGRRAPLPDAPGAVAFDRRLRQALLRADSGSLAGLLPQAERVGCRTGPVWREMGRLTGGSRWESTVHHQSHPLGVTYVVAEWRRLPPPR